MYCIQLVILFHPLRLYTFNSHSYLLDCYDFLPFSFQHAPPGVERLLIGNKCDLEARRAVESERGEQLAQELGIPFMETSAKTGHNINEVRGHFVMPLDVITSMIFLQALNRFPVLSHCRLLSC